MFKLNGCQFFQELGEKYFQYFDCLLMYGLVIGVEYYVVIGSCCFDGVDFWVVN